MLVIKIIVALFIVFKVTSNAKKLFSLMRLGYNGFILEYIEKLKKDLEDINNKHIPANIKPMITSTVIVIFICLDITLIYFLFNLF